MPPVPKRRLESALGSGPRQLWQVNKYLWMSLAFLLVYLPLAYAQGEFLVSAWAAWALFGMALAQGGARTLLAYLRGGTLSDSWAWAFTLADVALVAVAIAATRGLESDLWLLFFVIMIFESLYATRLQKNLLNLLTALAYLGATLPYQMQAMHVPWPVYWRVAATRLFFVILVSSLGRRISFNRWEREHELALLREQMATGEERARIAREVHDGLGHALVGIILRLELAARLVKKAPDEAEAILKDEVPALRAAWNEGRDLAFHLRPWESEAGGATLAELLRRHIGRFAERTGLSVDFAAEPDAETLELPPACAFALTRIVQEALTNAAKHAEAARIEVSLRCGRGWVACAVCDDGRGFDAGADRSGFGLQSMRERAAAQGGSLEIESLPGRGTTLRVTLPTK